MNSYNDNLRSTVFETLQSQNLDQQKLESQLKAEKLKLYYAQGARIDAKEKLTLAESDMAFKAKVKTQAVDNANVSHNVLASATQEKKYMDLSVNNAATCASNIQIAANAVLKLASDIGSISSIVNAADYGEEIYTHAMDAKSLMDKTAYNAELASQHAMEASTYTAEVSYKKVLKQATLTNTNIDNLLKVAEAEYNSVSDAVKTDNTALATDSNSEKVIEGQLEDVNVDYYAAKRAYANINDDLNLNLQVPKKKRHASNFTVTFNTIQTAFQTSDDKNRSNKGAYPVEDYYLVIVKNKNRATFGLANAENLFIQNKNKQLIEVGIPSTPIQSEDTPVQYAPLPNVTLTKKINVKDVLDADGDEIKLGENYVVFVFAQLSDTYKRKINNFEDYLSAPSQDFSLAFELDGPSSKNIDLVTVVNKAELKEEVDQQSIEHSSTGKTVDAEEIILDYTTNKEVLSNTLRITLDKSANESFDVEYRCMFLPMIEHSFNKGILTRKGLKDFEEEIELIESIYEEYQPILEAAQAKYFRAAHKFNELDEKLQKLDERIEEVQKEIDETSSETKKKELNTKKDKLSKEYEKIQNSKNYTNAKEDMAKYKEQMDEANSKKQEALKNINHLQHDKIGFYFDRTIAEQVSASNYYNGVEQEDSGDDSTKVYEVTLDQSTTDNFGNPLVEGERYVPVVLTVSSADEENLDMFQSHLSNYNSTRSFIYHPITNN